MTSQIRFHAHVYPDQYTNSHTTHRYLTGIASHELKARVEREGGRVSLVPVRLSGETASFERVAL